jgi:tRNA1Val (adenine37-N6)-methyltransferase
METPPFKFKKFELHHHNSTMKVGTDAVLLGSEVRLRIVPQNILDIGTGCGVLALMMAQKYEEADIIAIDIDEPSVIEAQKNFENSTWSQRIKAQKVSFQDFCADADTLPKFELIITNPPYFKYENPTEDTPARQNARQQSTLNFEDICENAVKILHRHGLLFMIVPYDATEEIEQIALNNGLYIQEFCTIIPQYGKQPNLAILGFGFDGYLSHYFSIAIRDSKGEYTDRYKENTQKYYTIF